MTRKEMLIKAMRVIPVTRPLLASLQEMVVAIEAHQRKTGLRRDELVFACRDGVLIVNCCKVLRVTYRDDAPSFDSRAYAVEGAILARGETDCD